MALRAIETYHDLTILGRHDDVIVISVELLSSMINPKAIAITIAVVADISDIGTEIATIWLNGVVTLHLYQHISQPEIYQTGLTSLQRNTPPPKVHAILEQTPGPAPTMQRVP